MNLFSFIKQHIALLDVVSEYATLKKAGMYFKEPVRFTMNEPPPSRSVLTKTFFTVLAAMQEEMLSLS